MWSVFFHMSQFILDVVFSIIERYIGEERAFVEEVKLTFGQPQSGWLFGAISNDAFAEYRSRNFLFRPRVTLMHETEAMKLVTVVTESRPHERVYVSWKEAASDDFFKDVETLFKRVQKVKGGE